MPVDDRTRLNLHRKLEVVLGSEEADTLMSHLPPVTWDQVATSSDIDALGSTLRAEIAASATQLRTDLESQNRQLRTEVASQFQQLRTEMQSSDEQLRYELRTEIATFRGDVLEMINRQTTWLVAFAAGWSTLLLTAVRLLP
jgi:DNA anti-recombination protein RmuC